MKNILLHAYGNPGRGDDGLGNAFIEAMEQWIRFNEIDGITTDSSYQLNVEDAAVIADYDVVVFIDASKAEIGPYVFDRVEPKAGQSFTTHSISPDAVLALCEELYHRAPDVRLLQIRGYEWDFREGLSKHAVKNLDQSLTFIKTTLHDLLK